MAITKAEERRAGRERWRRWAERRRNGRAICPVEYDSAVLGRLILAGWLRPTESDSYTGDAIGRAVSDLLARGAIPKRPTR
jgi:hypothetical protein